LETPFFGVHQMTWHLRNDGHLINEKSYAVVWVMA
jgi:putative transposase